ncbi:hypothetical protein N658DRAFT_494995 [Parathielavia hyrcaniae]|uniref:Uncharacterized protein n=1 Tax=Parathielavia hyrcaniae TaxID=113614 RepID=A0AAN6Q900_9PEZI|nr:hypothetical protein N658DRAFT_494995 [Parathielavia hyrcaniae]
MDEAQGCQPDEWTTLFVSNVQAERQRREDHTTDKRRSIQDYTAAADRKIREALGPNMTALAPVSMGTAATGKHKTKTR